MQPYFEVYFIYYWVAFFLFDIYIWSNRRFIMEAMEIMCVH